MSMEMETIWWDIHRGLRFWFEYEILMIEDLNLGGMCIRWEGGVSVRVENTALSLRNYSVNGVEVNLVAHWIGEVRNYNNEKGDDTQNMVLVKGCLRISRGQSGRL